MNMLKYYSRNAGDAYYAVYIAFKCLIGLLQQESQMNVQFVLHAVEA